jgi:hypothetical protein
MDTKRAKRRKLLQARKPEAASFNRARPSYRSFTFSTRNHHQESGSIESPERLLISAVIDRAIRDAFSIGDSWGVTKAERSEAADWLMSNKETPWSFVWCADHLGMNVTGLRRNMLHLSEAA